MRDWNLTAKDPLAMRFAADCRLSRTDYADDQSWEVTFGSAEEPAISVQSQYGGRAGLVRIVPMWTFAEKAIYQTAGYASPFTLRRFTPNYARYSAKITPTLEVAFHLWVAESHLLAGVFTLVNRGTDAVSLALDLIPQVAREGRLPTLKLLRFESGLEVVSLGQLANLYPVLLMDGAENSHAVQAATPKLSSPLTLAPNETASIRWVHSGSTSLNASISEGQHLLAQDWKAAFELIARLNEQQPRIETGDTSTDAVLAFSEQVILRSFLNSTGKLPYPSLVGTRIPQRGYGSSSGVNHPADWMGQSIQATWLVAPTAALYAPDLARGLIRNLIAVRKADGWIDWAPGLGGQRANILAMPLLASTAWSIYEITEDKHFLTEIYPALQEFFLRWFGRDMDRDNDGAPEWTNAAQAGQPDSSLFNRFRRDSASADISKAETPDLLAMLLREGESLLKIEALLPRKSGMPASVSNRVAALRILLGQLWDGQAFVNRDRDTHQVPRREALYTGKGDEWFSGTQTLNAPNRLLIRILGGQSHAPQISIQVEGINAQGKPIHETVPLYSFVWYAGIGTAVSEQVYQQITLVKADGLSRVYTMEVETVDLSQPTLLNLLPLWAGATEEQASTLRVQLRDYLKTAGLPMSIDPALQEDSTNRQVTMFWNAILLEALLDRGFTEEARELLRRLLTVETTSLMADHAFRLSYHAETGVGMGDPDPVAGILPIHLVLRTAGVRVVSARRVWAGGPFLLDRPLTLNQYGVTVTRSAESTRVQFPSGYQTTVSGEWQLIEDPNAAPEELPTVPEQQPDPDFVEAIRPPSSAVIPVETRRDPTTEVNISHIDFTDGQKSEPTEKTYKIPVRRTDEK